MHDISNYLIYEKRRPEGLRTAELKTNVSRFYTGYGNNVMGMQYDFPFEFEDSVLWRQQICGCNHANNIAVEETDQCDRLFNK
jgi:hypothetical protein